MSSEFLRSLFGKTALGAVVCGAALGACVPKQSSPAPEAAPSGPNEATGSGPQSVDSTSSTRSGPPAPMERNLSQHLAPLFSFGIAMEPHYLGEYGPLVASTFNRLTAENVMKFAKIHPQKDVYQYGPADQLADFARKHDMRMTGHALVWYRETPGWLVALDKKAALEHLKGHVDAVVARYADITDNWDVINEGISDTQGKMYRDGAEGSKLFDLLGEDLITETFRYAEAAVKKSGKDIELYYNDYNMVQPDKLEKALKMAKKLQAAGIRIDGIGAQAHWNMTHPTVAGVQKLIDDIVAAGLKVKISELDISIYDKDDWANEKWQPVVEFTPELAKAQAARYKELFDVFAKNAEHITSVTVWGLSDDRTWLDDFPAKGRDNHPLLFDDNDDPKPAYFALFDVNTAPAAPASDK